MYQLKHPGLTDLVISQVHSSHVGILLNCMGKLYGSSVPDLVFPQVKVANAKLRDIYFLSKTETQFPFEVVSHLKLGRNYFGERPAMRVIQVVLLKIKVLNGGTYCKPVRHLLQAVGPDVSLINH